MIEWVAVVACGVGSAGLAYLSLTYLHDFQEVPFPSEGATGIFTNRITGEIKSIHETKYFQHLKKGGKFYTYF